MGTFGNSTIESCSVQRSYYRMVVCPAGNPGIEGGTAVCFYGFDLYINRIGFTHLYRIYCFVIRQCADCFSKPLLKKSTSLSPLMKSVISIRPRLNPLPSDLTSKAAAICCTFELLTDVNIGEVEPFRIFSKRDIPGEHFIVRTFSNFTTFWPDLVAAIAKEAPGFSCRRLLWNMVYHKYLTAE